VLYRGRGVADSIRQKHMKKMIHVGMQKTIIVGLTLALVGVFTMPQMADASFAQDLKDKYDAFFLEKIEKKEKSFPVSEDRKPVRTMTVYATSYSSDPNQTDSTPCIDASGIDICERAKQLGEADTIAANFLPKGTKVRFPEMYGNKVFTVTDRMNSRYNYANIGYYRIDFYSAVIGEDGEIDMDASRQAARNFGFKKAIAMDVLGA